MMVVWLSDKPNYDKIFITIKTRTKKDEEGHSLTLSKSFKDLIKAEGYTHMRLGYESLQGNSYALVINLNKDNLGIPLLNSKESVRLWFDVAEYVKQYSLDGIHVPVNCDVKMNVKKNGNLESDAIPIVSQTI